MKSNFFMYGCIAWTVFIHGLVFFNIGKEIGNSGPTILTWDDFILIPFILCWFPITIGFAAG